MNQNSILMMQIEQDQKASAALAERQKNDADALHEKYLKSSTVDIPKETKESERIGKPIDTSIPPKPEIKTGLDIDSSKFNIPLPKPTPVPEVLKTITSIDELDEKIRTKVKNWMFQRANFEQETKISIFLTCFNKAVEAGNVILNDYFLEQIFIDANTRLIDTLPKPQTIEECYYARYNQNEYDINVHKFTFKDEGERIVFGVGWITHKTDATKAYIGCTLWDNKEHKVLYENDNIETSKDCFRLLQTIVERNKFTKLFNEISPLTITDLSKKLLNIAVHLKDVFSWMKIEYESVDDIIVSSNDSIAPMSFIGLPTYNYIHETIRFTKSFSHVYPEIAWQNGLATLSIATRRRLFFHIDGSNYYTNLWLMFLAKSGCGKTPAYNKTIDITKKALGDVFLSNPGSIQGLRMEMADEVYIKKTDHKVGTTEWVLAEKGSDNFEIRRALCPLCLDEAGTLLALLAMPFSNGESDALNAMYGCNEDEEPKILTGKKVKTGSRYLTMNLSTTPGKFQQYLNLDQTRDGFYPRLNIINPSYPIEIQDHKLKDLKEDIFADAFAKELKLIDSLLCHVPLEITFDEEFYDLYNKWSKERHQYFLNQGNDTMSSFWGKFQINALKVAILIELGNLPAYLSSYLESQQNPDKLDDTITLNSEEIISFKGKDVNNPKSSDIVDTELTVRNERIKLLNDKYHIKDYKIKSIKVGIQSLKYAMWVYDNIYLKYHAVLFENVSDTRYPQYSLSFLNTVKKQRKISRSEMTATIGGKPVDLDMCEKMFEDIEKIRIDKVKGKTKPMTMYTYTPTSSKVYPFKTIITMDETINNAVIVISNKDNPKEPKSQTIEARNKTTFVNEENIPKIVKAFKDVCSTTGKDGKMFTDLIPSEEDFVQIEMQTTVRLTNKKMKYTPAEFVQAKEEFYKTQRWK